MPFEPGKSGNPAGKLKGTRNKTTLAVEALLDGEAETITRKARKMVTWQRCDYVSTGLLRLGKTAPCSLSYRPFQAPRTQPKQQRHSWRRLRSAISPLLRLASLASG